MLAYCDYIANRIQSLVKREIGDNDTLISDIGNIQLDLHPTQGYMVSTKKTMSITDSNGKAYMVTIEEV